MLLMVSNGSPKKQLGGGFGFYSLFYFIFFLLVSGLTFEFKITTVHSRSPKTRTGSVSSRQGKARTAGVKTERLRI